MSVMLFSLASMAQFSSGESNLSLKEAVMVKEHVDPNILGVAAADPTDTLGLEYFDVPNGLTYSFDPNGFIFGTNDDTATIQGTFLHVQTHEVAAGFIAESAYHVAGALILFHQKNDVSGSPADLNVNIHSLAEDGALAIVNSGGQPALEPAWGPDDVLGSVNLPFDDVDTTNWTTVYFDQPVWVPYADFAIGVEFAALYSQNGVDTVAIYNDDHVAGEGDYTWTRTGFDANPGTGWNVTHTYYQNDLEVNLAIFAIVAESGTGIEEQGYLNGVKMTTYPNPTVASENFTIQYGLETSVKNVDINIYNMNGQVVHTSALGGKASGLYNLNIPAGTLSAGSYIYSIDADGRRMAKRLEVLK